jgi:hypothetical protein
MPRIQKGNRLVQKEKRRKTAGKCFSIVAEHWRCSRMLSVTERTVYGASMSAVPQHWLNSKIVGLLTLKRPEGRAPTNRWMHWTTGSNLPVTFSRFRF